MSAIAVSAALEEHPAAALLPSMTDSDFAALKEDIRVNGQAEPVVVFDGLLLDGRHRYRACVELGIEPLVRQFVGTDPIAFVISANVKRRHLTPSQLAMVAAQAEALYVEDARSRRLASLSPQGDNGPGEPGRSIDKAAALVGASPRSASRAKRIVAEAPDLAEKVQAGDMTVRTAEYVVEVRDLAATDPAKFADLLDEAEARPTEAASTLRRARQRQHLGGGKPERHPMLRKTRHIDSNRIVNETVMALEGVVVGLQLVVPDDLDPSRAEEWATSLSNSVRSLNRLIKQLKEMAPHG